MRTIKTRPTVAQQRLHKLAHPLATNKHPGRDCQHSNEFWDLITENNPSGASRPMFSRPPLGYRATREWRSEIEKNNPTDHFTDFGNNPQDYVICADTGQLLDGLSEGMTRD